MKDRALLASLQKSGGITAAEAAIVLALYRKMGLVTSRGLTSVSGKGAYLDRAVIRHALALSARALLAFGAALDDYADREVARLVAARERADRDAAMREIDAWRDLDDERAHAKTPP